MLQAYWSEIRPKWKITNIMPQLRAQLQTMESGADRWDRIIIHFAWNTFLTNT